MTITVHHLQVSQSERIVWLCEELGLDYNLQLYKRSPIFSPPEIKALNPLGAAPILDDDSFGTPIRLSESAAIVEWIVQKHGNGKLFLDKSHKDYADFLYWWHASNGTIQPAVSRVLAVSSAARGDPNNPTLSNYVNRLKILFDHVNERLLKVPHLAGEEFTAADIMTVFSFTTMRVFYPVPLEGYDGILRWLQRCTDRAAYKRALEKSDPEMKPQIRAEAPELFPPIKAMRG
ncbi:hypothetical protein LTR64_003927 [Lithohypha guttulata]|uniref:uncharacterized protein n=1 Tax=Lithohypha guttulata TaxID=1690604 RepID=UPI002DDFA685|nr:hypothetical protein LTR51_006965 [Lithohypha guttulata]